MISKSIDLKSLNLAEPIATTKRKYEEHYPGSTGLGFYSNYDWARISYVFELVKKGGSILDIGVGAAQFLNSLGASKLFHPVIGIDIKIHSKYVKFNGDFDFIIMDATQMYFKDKSFDVIVCMEVLEHVKLHQFKKALKEFRRVCRHQLIMTVPYKEPEPLPNYHKLRFTEDDITKYFPNAKQHLLLRAKVPWILLEELMN